MAKELANRAIDAVQEELHAMSMSIYNNPELANEEHHAHATICDLLESHKFVVERSYILPTAFKAKFGNGKGPTIAVLCEYDCLPVIKHACGHHLIAECGVAAGIAIKAALQDGELEGNIVVYGTPAEEDDGGKIHMIKGGMLDGIDVAMMCHPSTHDTVWTNCLSLKMVIVTFRGKASHAAGEPWEGINALDAIVMAYNGISMLRQQIKPTWRVHGVITKGGDKANIIPDHTAGEFYIRAPTDPEVDNLQHKFINIFTAAAKATGCTVEFKWDPNAFSSVFNNAPMCGLYQKNAEAFGTIFPPKEEQLKRGLGSTDFGNVSYVVPGIHPEFCIPATGGCHTKEFMIAGASDEAHARTLVAAKSLAHTAIDLLSDAKLLTEVKTFFTDSHPYGKGAGGDISSSSDLLRWY